eukprot:1183350-Prorocentrum_minimum.AAC.6
MVGISELSFTAVLVHRHALFHLRSYREAVPLLLTTEYREGFTPGGPNGSYTSESRSSCPAILPARRSTQRSTTKHDKKRLQAILNYTLVPRRSLKSGNLLAAR